jgi:Uma2 family endonuclease
MIALSANRTQFITPAEYLETERTANEKHEYYEGEVFAMAGGTYRHSRLKMRLAHLLEARLSGKRCRPTDADMRVKMKSLGLYTYPDASVVCGKPEFEDGKQDTLLNPTVIFEVLSESTESYDRGKKFWFYRHLESFTDDVLINQNDIAVEHYKRQINGGWLMTEAEGLEAVMQLPVLDIELPLAELYRDIDPME